MCRKLACIIVLIMVLHLTLTNTARTELVGWWKLDETSGGIAFDSGGNSNDGTIQGDPQWVDGQLGGAWQGDGTAAYIRVPHSETLMVNDAITVALWLYGGIPPDQVLCKSDGSGAGWQSNYAIRLDDQAPARRINWRGRAVANQSLTSPSPVPDNEWVHIACTFDLNAQGNNQKIYINGQLDAKNQSTLPLNPGSGDLYIGADQYPVNGVRWWFQGMFDDIRIYDQALPEGQIQAIMLGGGASYPLASRPSPADGTIHEDTWVTLSWSAGDFAVSHDVYLGESLNDVSNAMKESEVFRGNQTSTFYVAGFPGFAYPEGLVPGTTYYWRIDEVNEADPNSPWEGNVWSFSIPPKTAYNPDPADGMGVAETTVTLSWTAGFGAKLHTIYFGDDFDTVVNAAVGTPVGTTSYNPGPLELEKVYYWRVDEFDGIGTYKGDVWTFTTPGAVGNPQPANGTADVAMATILSWTAADNAVSHEVYIGLDKDTVRSADTTSREYKGSKSLGAESYDPGLLEPDTTYYWRIDEVYNGNSVKGPVWSFMTGTFLLVDDFEGYTDDDVADEAIWQTWIDGFGVADNGAQVGYMVPPYAEQTIVHGGDQSMPLLYANEAGVTNSEGVLPLTALRDWTTAGVAELSLWFQGNSGNAPEPLYVAISDSAGALAIVINDDSEAALTRGWNEFVIPLQAFTDQGINLTNVDKLAIGLGTTGNAAAPGGSGTMYFDDIRLYRP